MSPLRAGATAAAALLLCSCVAGSKVRADAEVITNDIDRLAKSNEAIRCAPGEMAYAMAYRDFALGELDRGNSFRAQDDIEIAKKNVKKAKELAESRGCTPMHIRVAGKDLPPDKP